MLIAGRRRALLTFCLAGIEVAWFTPFVLLFVPPAWRLPVLLPFAALWLVLLLWLLLLDGLNRLRVPSPQYELSVAGLLLFSTLLFDRLLLYAGRPAADLTWLGNTVRTLFDLAPGAGQLVVVILANVFLWQRAASFTGSNPTFFGVGVSFRLGLLLFVFGAALLEALAGANMTPLVWVYFACGLAAVSLARIEDKSAGAQSAGSPLPVARLLQLLLTVAVTVALAAGIARGFNRHGIVAVATWLGPLWRVLGFVFEIVFTVLWWLLTPVMVALEFVLRRLAESGAMQGLLNLADALAGQRQLLQPAAETAAMRVPPWLWTAARYAGVILVLLLLAGSVLLFLERVRGLHVRTEVEEEAGESVSLGSGILAAAAERMRELAGLARRYGVSRQLLAAVSVQNIYANVARLARRRGFPRRPAQPPDDYLPVLRRAFPGQDAALSRITAAYMRVHYGDHPVTLDELAALRAAYHEIRRAPRASD